jgi:NADH:ubiquinone oxidoreductase subunit E
MALMAEQKITTVIDTKRVDQIIARHRAQKWPLIPLLQEIQSEYGYIPSELIKPISKALGLFPAHVQGVISFYEQFYTTPRGRNIVRVCRGTACHVRGGKTILKLVKEQLGVEEGQTTPDMEYTLETVACIGVCALAPNMVIGKDTHGHMNPRKVSQLLVNAKREE